MNSRESNHEATTELSIDEITELDERRYETFKENGIDEEEVLRRSADDVRKWESYFNDNITRGKDDLNFVLRDQWSASERSEFRRLFKPAMTCNKLYDAVKKICGEQRKIKPDPKVRSLTGKATQQQINLRADLVRTISYQSQNELVYQQAFKNALLQGFGAFQVCIDYESPTSFNQIITFDLITEPNRTYFDPIAKLPHKGDGNYCSRHFTMMRDQFEATYPYIHNPTSYFDARTLLDYEWQTKDTVGILDYFVKEWFSTIVYKLSDGRSVTKDQWEDMEKLFDTRKKLAAGSAVVGQMILDEIPKIVMERQTQDYRIMHYRLIRDRIIDFREWPSRQLPIIFVDGDSHYIEGLQYTRSFTHEAKDTQRFLNYVMCEVAAEIKNRRREQWLGTPDNIRGQEQLWRNPELQVGILIANPDPKTGQMPSKLPPWEMSQSLLMHHQRATMDIKEVLGFTETNVGNSPVVTSGIGIRQKQLSESMSSYVYLDNLDQAVEQGWRVVLDLLPVVYGDDERHLIVTKNDGKTESVILNKKNDDGTIENAMEKGEYDIEINTGPSFGVQKEQSVEFLIEIVKANPQLMNLVGDLLAKNLDVQFAQQLSDRLRTLVPPDIIAKEEGKPPPPPQPNPVEQQQQMQMQLAAQQLQERAADLKLRHDKHEIEKAELAMKAQKFMDEMASKKIDRSHDMHKTELEYSAKIAKVIADLHGKKKDNE